MESYRIENLSFTYPSRENPTLKGINLTVNQGEFITLIGKSGCGKTTLLRLLKTSLAPFGTICGSIYWGGKPLSSHDIKEQSAKIGFVLQNPDNQIVTDKVWHELAFGLESLGYQTPEIRARVSEMASFFGIHGWFHKNVTELSGGQKQLLNLASVMVLDPSVLILDEPTSQLDPIAAGEFLKTLEKINRELGVTVIITEHRPEEIFPISDRVIVMDSGEIIADATPGKVGDILKELNHDMYAALPTPMRIHGATNSTLPCPLTIREGREWLSRHCETHTPDAGKIPGHTPYVPGKETVIELLDIHFRYEKSLPDVLKGFSVKIAKGELFAILGGNGTGKSTALSIMSGLNKPYRGKVLINGEKPSSISNLYSGNLGVLPQDPQSLFVKNTVYLDLMEILSQKKLSAEEKKKQVMTIATLCRIDTLLDSHPYDLSGGEQQRAALAKVLLTRPRILLMDEPTKGMDAHFKEIFAGILSDLKANGVTIVMVSHDIEFCAEFADRCVLVFDGIITSVGTPGEFFRGKSFYTTAANRMARTIFPDAIIADDVIFALVGKCEEKKTKKTPPVILSDIPDASPKATRRENKLSKSRIIAGCVFILLFILTCLSRIGNIPAPNADGLNLGIFELVLISEIIGAFVCLFPQREFGTEFVQSPKSGRKLSKRTAVAAILILLLIPLTIYTGIYFLGNRKYYFISLLIIFETLIPFFMVFESRKPEARELIIISVMCAIAVAGRSAFFMLPQFKPVTALVIIAGVCFGGETGFLAGAVTGFVSNFFFGQGPWAPWQMFAFGIIGFLAGVLFKKGLLRKTRASLCIFGAFAAYAIYGGLMNPASVLILNPKPTADMITNSFLLGMPFDLIHSLSTAFFLWFIAEPMIDKLERVKVKYGIIER